MMSRCDLASVLLFFNSNVVVQGVKGASMTDPVTVIIPARNEVQTIGQVVTVLSAMADVAEIVVIDNASSDATAAVARAAGARVVAEPRPGMGYAVRAGIAAATHGWVMKVDADLGRFETGLFARMTAARGPGVGLVKGAWQDPKDNMPMTRLLVKPALRLMFPGLGHLTVPNSGIYLFDRSLIAHEALIGDYAVDLDVMLRVHAAGHDVVEVDIGRIVHDSRDVGHYNRMAEEILRFFLSRQAARITEEIVVLSETAEKVIRHALGVLVTKSSAGGRVTVYLGETTAPEAGILREVLAPYPTARVRPLGEANDFAPHGNATGRIVLSAPALTARARVLGVAGEGQSVDLLAMPPGGGGGLAPDIAFDIGPARAIKAAALARLSGKGQADCGRTEVFQSLIP